MKSKNDEFFMDSCKDTIFLSVNAIFITFENEKEI
jgi:hypothetical protein